jgi:hypothetical protein
MTGTLVNAGAIITGSLIGLFIHTRLPKKIITIVFHGIGLFTLFIGVKMALKTEHLVIMVMSLVLGSIIGELIRIDDAVNRFGDYIKEKLKMKRDKFSEGFVTSFLLFCMGSLTILGAIEEGLGEAPNLLLAKSVLDGFSSIALTISLGIGVIFSIIPLLIYQGGLTLFAGSMQELLNEPIINELSAIGGLLLIGMGLNILELKKIKILNMLPALIIVVVLTCLFG